MNKYVEEPKDISRQLAEVNHRLKALESGNRIGFTSVDSGSLVAAGDGGSAYLTADSLPSDLVGFYQFWNKTVIVGRIFQMDDQNYTWDLFIRDNSDNAVSEALGIKRPDGFAETMQLHLANPDTARLWVGFLSNSDLVLGSFLGHSSLTLNNGGIYIGEIRTFQCVGLADALCDTNLTLSTSQQNVSGALVSITTHADAVAEVTGMFDFECTAAGTSTCLGGLVVDGGSAETEQARFAAPASGDLANVSQVWHVTMGSAGSHTFQLVALKSAAAGTHRANLTHTKISVKIWSQ